MCGDLVGGGWVSQEAAKVLAAARGALGRNEGSTQGNIAMTAAGQQPSSSSAGNLAAIQQRHQQPTPHHPLPQPHLLHAVAGISILGKHCLPHMLHLVRPLALYAFGAVKVAVGSYNCLGGQPCQVLQGVDILQARGGG